MTEFYPNMTEFTELKDKIHKYHLRMVACNHILSRIAKKQEKLNMFQWIFSFKLDRKYKRFAKKFEENNAKATECIGRMREIIIS